MSLTTAEDLLQSLLDHSGTGSMSSSTSSAEEEKCIPTTSGVSSAAATDSGEAEDIDRNTAAIQLSFNVSPVQANSLEKELETAGAHKVSAVNPITTTHWLDESITANPLSVNDDSQPSMSLPSIKMESPRVKRKHSCFTSKHEEAALFILEGEDDSKVYHHPTNKWSWKAYEIVHHRAYYLVHLLVCVGILLLAFAETPYIGEDHLNANLQEVLTSVHAVVELIFLTLIAINVVLYMVWLQSKFVKHRILFISIILVVLYVEAVVVMARQRNHFRITRLFRPFFLLDAYYMRGVRRVARQILAVLKPIVDVLVLLIFFIFLFTLFGYLIFAGNDPNYFGSFGKSFLSLFISTTTANHPDVMMGSYSQNAATPIFFVIYLILTLYFASNVLLAVVYTSFSEVDKRKYKKLFCHRRDALLRAFRVLTDVFSPGRRLQLHDFILLMHHFRPSMPEWQVVCIFKSLNKNPHGEYSGLDEDDFLRFYEVLDFNWSQVDSLWTKIKWYSNLSPKYANPFEALHKVVSHRFYKFFIGLVVVFNLVFLVIIAIDIKDPSDRYSKLQKAWPGTTVFLFVYSVDVVLNMISYGPYNYLSKFWNLFNVFIILLSIISTVTSFFYHSWVVLLPLKLVRFIHLKRSYRDLLKTAEELAPRLLSMIVLILIIYYCFAIIGMEFLWNRVREGCCTKALYGVQQYYADSANFSNTFTASSNVYYFNNFDNILRSYVTLFILMVVNNWYVIMEGFASEVDPNYMWLTRIYFMVFYLIMLVVLQVIIAFVVEAFQLKIQATAKRRICHKHPDNAHCGCPQETRKKVIITLVEADLTKLNYEISYMDTEYLSKHGPLSRWIKMWRRRRFKARDRNTVYLVGSRPHTKEDVHQLHYKEEIKVWRRERSSKSVRRQPTQNSVRQTLKLVLMRWIKSILNFIVD